MKTILSLIFFGFIFLVTPVSATCIGGPCYSLISGSVGYDGGTWTGSSASGVGNPVSNTYAQDLTDFTTNLTTVRTVSPNPNCDNCDNNFERFEIDGVQKFAAGAINNATEKSVTEVTAKGHTDSFGMGERVGFENSTFYKVDGGGVSQVSGTGHTMSGNTWGLTEASGEVNTTLVREASLAAGCVDNPDCSSNFQTISGDLKLHTVAGGYHEASGSEAVSMTDTSVYGNTKFIGNTEWFLMPQ